MFYQAFKTQAIVLSLLMTGLYTSCQTSSTQATAPTVAASEWSATIPDQITRVEKSEDEWKGILSKMEYYVIREKGTERPFTGDLLHNKEEGLYVCRACGLPLFSSESKFKSGTGWPSYFEPVKKEFIKEDTDYHIGYARTEVMCAQCDGHLGHVFPDGPRPTGLRYCINAVSLDFVSTEKDKEGM